MELDLHLTMALASPRGQPSEDLQVQLGCETVAHQYLVPAIAAGKPHGEHTFRPLVELAHQGLLIREEGGESRHFVAFPPRPAVEGDGCGVPLQVPLDDRLQIGFVEEDADPVKPEGVPEVKDFFSDVHEKFLIEGALAHEIALLHILEAFLFGFNDLEQTAEDVVLVLVDFGGLPPEGLAVAVLVFLPLLNQLVFG